jgi:hypothetical protein
MVEFDKLKKQEEAKNLTKKVAPLPK